jgi:adenine phosphoribosyltransferase
VNGYEELDWIKALDMLEILKTKIRDIHDFPKPGVIFKDITPLLGDPQAFNMVVNLLADRYIGQHIDRVVGVEARGFILGAALAYKLNTGLILVRKPGKLPADTLKAAYELEYGVDQLEIHRDALAPGSRVVLVDDVIATGGTIRAALALIKKLQCEVVELAFLIELCALRGRQRLQGYTMFSLFQY